MDREILRNRKDDFKAYTAPHGLKQDGCNFSVDAMFGAVLTRNIDYTTAVRPQYDTMMSARMYTCKPNAGDCVGPVINRPITPQTHATEEHPRSGPVQK
jgi:hypothetical protein